MDLDGGIWVKIRISQSSTINREYRIRGYFHIISEGEDERLFIVIDVLEIGRNQPCMCSYSIDNDFLLLGINKSDVLNIVLSFVRGTLEFV